VPQDAHFKKRYPTLEQNAVLNATASAVLVNALAGTGKTTTLAIKAADLLRTQTASRILMLAYSEAGLAAIAQRLEKFVPTIPRQVQIMTVEQLCATVLKEQGDPLVRVTEPLQKNLLVRQAHTALLQDPALDRAPEAGDFLSRELDVQAFADFEARAKQRLLLRDMDRSDLGALPYCREHQLDYGLYQLLVKYERLRRGLNHEPHFYAPGDCTYEVATQLGELDFGDAFAPLQGRFDAVLFDELQDLDEAAMLVLRHLVQGGNGLFVGAGDFNQHILPGAFSVFGDSLARIRQELPADTQVVALNTTYRFGNAICQGLNPLFGVEFAAHYPTKLSAFERRSYTDDEDCARQLLAIHDAVLHQLPHAPGGTAPPPCLNVVLRSPQDSILLEWMFAHEGVHYTCKGMKRFYQRREIALVLAIMGAMQGCGDGVRLTQGILSSAMDGLLRYVRRGSRTGTCWPTARSTCRRWRRTLPSKWTPAPWRRSSSAGRTWCAGSWCAPASTPRPRWRPPCANNCWPCLPRPAPTPGSCARTRWCTGSSRRRPSARKSCATAGTASRRWPASARGCPWMNSWAASRSWCRPASTSTPSRKPPACSC
jgi:superfamily I DNA/RNA helicase